MDFESDEPGFKSWLCLLTAPPNPQFPYLRNGDINSCPLMGLL